MPRTTTRIVYLCAGWGCLGLGFAGIFLPLLPTTPFVLLAAWCFSRGSARLHRWLLGHRRFGRLVRDWEENRAIRLRAKVVATLMMIPLAGYMLLGLDVAGWVKVLGGALMLSGLLFIWSRPSAAR